MSAFEVSRQKILASIRSATGGTETDSSQIYAAYNSLQRAYVRRGEMSRAEVCERMVERLREYDAGVTECAAEELATVIAAELKTSGRHSFVAPKDLPADLLALGFDWKIDRQLQTDEVEKVEGVVTSASCGIADSGTIVLHHTEGEGRRLLTLLPDWHLCILRESQVVETLPEYFSRFTDPPHLATYISGPSATADIEMTRIKGVHGPRFLVVILVRDV